VHVSAPEAVVDITGGGVALGGRPVLRGIDLSVSHGEVLAVLGANGSGKSTLVRAMTGLVPMSHGSVSLFGVPLHDFADWHRVGFVPQRATAASGVPASVWEVVTSGRLSRRRVFRPMRAADREAVGSAIEAVGLTPQARHGVATLSGGQQQRVLIARALAGQPELLVLDEPTAGVDAPSQDAFAAALESLVRAGATVVLVAHELGPLAPLIERVVWMRDGRVAHDGPPVVRRDADGGHHAEAHADTRADGGHHHPGLGSDAAAAVDYTPVVSSPLDGSPGRPVHR
jgi:zinc transport system ATP-binding protein